MDFWTVFVIGIGLSMDAFAVSVCKGLKMHKICIWQMLVIALFFGLFQMIMPILGYYLCIQFESYIVSFDHWIAFGLLAFLGIKMIVETLRSRKEEINKFNLEESKRTLTQESNKKNKGKTEDSGESVEKTEKFSFGELTAMAVATSIDALAIGITFAFFDYNIFLAGSIIGLTTFVLCCGGVLIGHLFGSKFKTWAELSGGIILILMGLKILLEHLGVLVL